MTDAERKNIQKAARAVQRGLDILHTVDNRCAAADGPVTPSRQEITDAEFRAVYRSLKTANEILAP